MLHELMLRTNLPINMVLDVQRIPHAIINGMQCFIGFIQMLTYAKVYIRRCVMYCKQ